MATKASHPDPERPKDAEDVEIYRNGGEFAGWPRTHGARSFDGGNELLVAFCRGHCGYNRDVKHHVVDVLRGEYVAKSSINGGQTWPPESLQSLGKRSELEQLLTGPAMVPETPVPWNSDDFFVTAMFAIPIKERANIGGLQFSRFRGRPGTWEGPYLIPDMGFPWVQATPDYLPMPNGTVLLFVTVSHDKEGRPGTRFPVVYAASRGGFDWSMRGTITQPSHDGVDRYYASPVLLPGGRIQVALRCQTDSSNAWPEIFESSDGGRTWRLVSRPSEWGGPTDMKKLDDGRMLIAYGYRKEPYGIRARISEDESRTWGPEILIRGGAGSRDVGYPVILKLSGGRVMVVYYFNDVGDPTQCNGGVRYIAGTTFTP